MNREGTPSVEMELKRVFELKEGVDPAVVWRQAIYNLLARMKRQMRLVSLDTIGDIDCMDSSRTGGSGFTVRSSYKWRKFPENGVLDIQGYFLQGHVNHEAETRKAYYYWGVTRSMDYVAIEIKFDYKADNIISSENQLAVGVTCTPVAIEELMAHPQLSMSYYNIWMGLASFFPWLVDKRKELLREARSLVHEVEREEDFIRLLPV